MLRDERGRHMLHVGAGMRDAVSEEHDAARVWQRLGASLRGGKKSEAESESADHAHYIRRALCIPAEKLGAQGFAVVVRLLPVILARQNAGAI